MREREEPVTQTMKAMEARQRWSRILDQVYNKETRVLVRKNGVPVVAVVSVDDLKQLERLDEERKRGRKILRRTRAAFADVPDDELQREVDKAVAEAREELRAERQAARRG